MVYLGQTLVYFYVRISTILKTRNKMVFKMVSVSNFCPVKTYGKNSVKQKSTQIWNDLVQHNLNLDLLDQSRPKTTNLFIEYLFKKLGIIITKPKSEKKNILTMDLPTTLPYLYQLQIFNLPYSHSFIFLLLIVFFVHFIFALVAEFLNIMNYI